MTVNIPGRSVVEIKLDMIELKLDRLIDEMRCLRSRTSAFDTRMRGIEAYLTRLGSLASRRHSIRGTGAKPTCV